MYLFVCNLSNQQKNERIWNLRKVIVIHTLCNTIDWPHVNKCSYANGYVANQQDRM